ncbi:uncharacterized protein BDZ99DRAFT_22924 [Mytilinidion resinicola]|uniref:Rhodopsin domain-containing protein n=1 Tax=Mytilinidion resinicola TaxID=574789 RepID=A0A6A6ZAH4_9PEZI|nr:uncharacterized protein BDZ99DRAFT_22924 [Mytilinidion resinicola]KAF2817699.1 hypothetical protein BDZ99DRAFT_22924 [Mytilinidion resinicola]
MATSRVAEITASLTITYVAAVTAVALRIFSRRLTGVALAFDDYAAVAAGFCATVFFAMKVYALTNGLGRHIQDIHKTTPVITTQHIMRDLWADDIPYSIGVCLAKLSILWLYWRMFKHSRIRIPIQVMAALSVMWFIARLVMTAIQCIPIHALWDYSVKGVCPIDPAKSFIATCATHAIIDFIIVLLPVFEVAKLHLPPIQKFSVALMFTSGLL